MNREARQRAEDSDIATAFEQYRARKLDGWGLAWFLAAEVCERFYRSHGIVPTVIEREGLGYYGIELEELVCRARPEQHPSLGRFTMAGEGIPSLLCRLEGLLGLDMQKKGAAESGYP